MVRVRSPESWVLAEPRVVEREVEAMRLHAPDMSWVDDLVWLNGRRASGWDGLAPPWGANRDPPTGLDELLGGRRLHLYVYYPEAFPAVAPVLSPVDPDPPLARRTDHRWHVNDDGTLCLTQAAADWNPTDTAADLVRKASGWLIEYLLMEAGDIEEMTERGIFEDMSCDEIISRYRS